MNNMAHYAFLIDNVVQEVIAGRDENDQGVDWESFYAQVRGMPCKRTSYNTQRGRHVAGGTPFRGNYAGIGYVYDERLDAFLPPKPSEDAVLDESTFSWITPS